MTLIVVVGSGAGRGSDVIAVSAANLSVTVPGSDSVDQPLIQRKNSLYD